ncbi:hypothetical protein EKO27_g4558 [Xylaria grammica]|uniref:Uncharacterized protein n=1 Tax=Xylaria grammica TaxID=363999 RepID=A0A439D826_9PEZI|nr:hypothetical protein EKO27_g4558 [Xylaria grammica]
MSSLWWNREPRKDSLSGFRKRVDDLKLWKRRKSLPASVDHDQGRRGSITEAPISSQAVNRPESPTVSRASRTSVATVESTILSNSCVTNDATTPGGGRAAMIGPKSLWDLAYNSLREERPDVVGAYEELLSKTLPSLANASSTTELENLLSITPSIPPNTTPIVDTKIPVVAAQSLASRRKMMEDIVDLGQKHMDGKRIAFKIGQQEFVLRDQMQYVVAGIQVGKDWINDAVKASPLASAAWAGVCLLLPLLTNPSEVQAVNAEGLAYVTQRIRYYTAMESLFLYGQDEEVFSAAVKREYEERLVELYQAIIDFQAQSVMRFFRRRFSNLLRETVKWDPWEEMLKKVKELGDNLEKESLQINTAANRAALGVLTRWQRESDEGRCLQSFKQGDYAWYKDRIEDRVPDTCLWFLNHASYQSWLETGSGPLLVSADPGCGKSVLTRYLIDSSFGFRVPKEAAICYFFFKEGDQNTIALAFCALIHQLLCLRPQLMRHALRRYRQNGEQLANNVTELWNILEDAAADPVAGTVIIVLDALDECLQDERNMATLSRYIRRHFEQGPKTLKILMTSRPYQSTVQYIQGLEETFPSIRINGEDESETIRAEINSVIEFRVSRMNKFDNNLKAHLRKRLLSITHWTYLWLYLVCAYLESPTIKSTIRGLDKAIRHLPTTVEDAYEKILSRSAEPKETRKAMLILLSAYRPLTLGEMQIALALNIKTSSLEELDMESDGKFKDRLRELCGLFITVHDKKVYFLHQTAREFLLPRSTPSPSPCTAIGWAHTLSLRQAHTVLAESCTIYLHLLRSPTDVNPEADMLDYSANNWGTHFREADISDGAAIVPFGLRICDPDSSSFSTWFEIWEESRGWDDTSTTLKIASFLGHKATVRLLLNTSTVDVDSRDFGGRTPLWWAVYHGYDAIVELLLGTGKVNVDSEDPFGRTPLACAAKKGYEAIVKLLIKTGKVDVNRKDKFGQTPLMCAAENGDEAMVKLLLTADKIDVDFRNQKGDTALFHAVNKMHKGVVKLLLDTGKVDVNSKDKAGCTVLALAAVSGQEAVVKFLLDTGKVNINARDSNHRTPRSWAAMHGHETIVQMLSQEVV